MVKFKNPAVEQAVKDELKRILLFFQRNYDRYFVEHLKKIFEYQIAWFNK